MPTVTDSEKKIAVENSGKQEDSTGWLSDYLIASTEQMIILFGLYVFSIGPMYWIWLGAKYVDGSYYIAALYEPLWILCGIVPFFGDWVNWYVRLWIF